MRIQKIAAAEGLSCRFFTAFAKIWNAVGKNAARGRSLLRPTFFPPLSILTKPNGQGVASLIVYLDLVMLLNFLVDALLLAGTRRIMGMRPCWSRILPAAAVGAVYAGVCLLPRFRFLGNLLWRSVFLGIMGAMCFGLSRSALRQSLLFVLLCMALGGAAICAGTQGLPGLITGALILFGLCAVGFRTAPASRRYARVVLRHGGKETSLVALVDTGNTLCDPVTGEGVLVADAQAAYRILGISKQQLRMPVETLASGIYPGLRLIPYRSVGQDGGMLLAIRMEDVTIDKWRGSRLVAFSPNGLDAEGTYQALTGGTR